jgi:hypothetical protein
MSQIAKSTRFMVFPISEEPVWSKHWILGRGVVVGGTRSIFGTAVLTVWSMTFWLISDENLDHRKLDEAIPSGDIAISRLSAVAGQGNDSGVRNRRAELHRHLAQWECLRAKMNRNNFFRITLAEWTSPRLGSSSEVPNMDRLDPGIMWDIFPFPGPFHCFFLCNSNSFLFKSKISKRTDSRNLSITINGNVDNQGAPSVPSQAHIRRNFPEYQQIGVQNGLTWSNG